MPTVNSTVREERRLGFERRNLQTFVVTEGNMQFQCFLLPASDLTEVPNAVLAYMPCIQTFWGNGGGPRDVVLAIDEGVPENVRKYPVLYEIWKDLIYDHEHRVVEAAKREIAAVQNDAALTKTQRTAYFKMRRAYWANMTKFAGKHADVYKPEDIQEFRTAWSCFERQLNPSEET